MDTLTGFVIKAEKTTAKSVSNFSQGLGEYESVADLLKALVNWINAETGENFQVKDLGDIKNYQSEKLDYSS